MFTFGCREYHIYEYKPVITKILDGKLVVQIVGSHGKGYEKDGKKYADYSFPYHLVFHFALPSENKLHKMVVKNLKITGIKSGRKYILPEKASTKIHGPIPEDKTYSTKVIVTGINSLDYEYEPFNLQATIEIYQNGTDFSEENIAIELETDFKKEKHSDWLDRLMSV